MTEKADLALLKQNHGSFCKLSGLLLLVSVLTLSACSFQDPFPKMLGKEDKEGVDITKSVSHVGPASPLPKREKRANNKNLFGENLRSDDQRLNRLERAVQDMRNEFDNVRPSIKRLMSIEGDIQNLIGELRKLNEGTAPAPMAAPMPQKAAAPRTQYTAPRAVTNMSTQSMQKKSPPPMQDGKASVFDVRTGEHPGKTRIVLDINGKTNFNVDIDNSENIMIVELPNASWSAAMSRNYGKSSYVSSYKAEAAGDGTMLIFQLRRNAQIGYKDDLGGKAGSRRIVIDLVGG